MKALTREEKKIVNIMVTRDYGFDPVHSTIVPGHVSYVRCCKCDKKLRVNQTIWQLRHYRKCEG